MSKMVLHQVKLLYDSTITLDEVTLVLGKLTKLDKTRVITRDGRKIPAYEEKTELYNEAPGAASGYIVTVTCDVDKHGSLVLTFTQKPTQKREKQC